MILLLCSSLYAQTSLDVIDKVTEKTYESLTEESKFPSYEAEIRTKMQETKQSFLDALTEHETEREQSLNVIQDKAYIDLLENKSTELKWKNEFLENEVDLLKKENEQLERKYALVSKVLYYMTAYDKSSPNEMKQFFSKKELEMCKKLFKEWEKIYD